MIQIGLGVPSRSINVGSAPPAPAVTLIYDSFTAADSTALTSRTPDTVVAPAASGVWLVQQRSGSPKPTSALIVGNKVVGNEGIRGDMRDAGVSDLTVSMVSSNPVLSSTEYVHNVDFRQALSNGYDNRWVFQRNFGTGVFHLIELNGGVATNRATIADSNKTEEATMKVVANGTSIECYRNDVLILSYTSSVHETNTYVGVSSFARTTATMDDFRVTTP